MSKIKVYSRLAAIVHDLVMIPIAWLASYLFRFNLEEIPPEYFHSAVQYLWLVIPVQAASFRVFGLYRGVWRFASLPDLLRILKGVLLGTLAILALLFVFSRLEDVPRSVPFLYVLFLVGLLGGSRFLYRWRKDHQFYLSRGKRVLIVGAGSAGEMLVRDLLRDRQRVYSPIAFVDDDASKQGRDLHGVPVIAGSVDIGQVVRQQSIDLILLAVPSASASEKQRIITCCENAGVPFRTVPQISELMSGQVSINQLREVSIEDLLGREPVKLDVDGIHELVNHKVVMVTGAGGSIGSELCRQVASYSPRSLILVENSEFNLYSIEQELQGEYPSLKIQSALVDVKDRNSIHRLVDNLSPSIIFHAAAYKHVPMLESHIREAAHNNILGTRNVADAANAADVDKFIMISTDKAVNPTNVMGATKRVAEIYCQNLNRISKTRFITVRFGNVLGSAGSVVPRFRKQIEAGGPVTVTHPEIERYFMTIPEACQLITQAAVLGDGGEIFVLDMGSPVKIQYLAEQMIRLSGKLPEDDIRIVYTGLRPGEKLYEELFHDQEEMSRTRHEQILLAHYRPSDWESVLQHMVAMENGISRFEENKLLDELMWFVPENKFDQDEASARTIAS